MYWNVLCCLHVAVETQPDTELSSQSGEAPKRRLSKGASKFYYHMYFVVVFYFTMFKLVNVYLIFPFALDVWGLVYNVKIY